MFGCLVGYCGPEAHIINENLKSAQIDTQVITDGIANDLRKKRVREASSAPSFICSPLGLVPKKSAPNSFRRIQHLSYPAGTSVNDGISREYGYLQYVKFHEFLDKVETAGQGAYMFKRDMKDAFRNIPLAPSIYWLFGFSWLGRFYTETCLPFGLRTAPFIFNLFAEALHWLLESYIRITALVHYLDDFAWVIPAGEATPSNLEYNRSGYKELINILGIEDAPNKDEEGTSIKFLGLLVDSSSMTASLPEDKLFKAIETTSIALMRGSLSYSEAKSLAG